MKDNRKSKKKAGDELANLRRKVANLEKTKAKFKHIEEILKEKVEVEQQFSKQLSALYEVSIELSEAKTFDEVCYRAIELGRSRLGFDRLSIWFIDKKNPDYEVGSFGVDENGKIRDESGEKHRIRSYDGLTTLLKHKKTIVYQEKAVLTNPKKEDLGQGERAVTSLWDGERVIGFLNTDNLFSKKPITEEQQKILILFAQILGHLFTRKQEERRSKAFAELGKRMGEVRSPKEAAKIIVDVADQLIGWDSCYLVLYSGQEDAVTPILAMDIIDGKRKEDFQSYGEGEPGVYMRQAILEGGFLILREKDPKSVESITFGDRSRRSTSLMFVPVREKDKVVGVLSIQSYALNAYTQKDLETLQALADHSGGAFERIFSEERLREGEKLLRNVFNKIFDSIIIIDMEGHILNVNESACNLIEYSKEELLKLSIEDIHPEKEMAKIKSVIGRISSKPVRECGETEFKTKDGRIVPVEAGAVAFDMEGKMCILGSFRDITDRKEAERALIEGEEKYRRFVETANEGIWVLDAENRTSYVNEKMANMLGYSEEEMKGQLLFKFMGEEEKLLAEANLERGHRGISENLDFRFKKKNGEDLWTIVSTTPIFDSEGNYKGALGMIIDITERKKAGEELRHIHQVYRATIENAMGIPYLFKFAQDKYELIGENCGELLGIAPEDLTFDKMRAIVEETVVTDPDAPQDPLRYNQAFKQGELSRYKMDYRIVTPKGEEKWISDCSVPIYDNKTGKVIGALGILNDITDRKRLEEKFLQSQKMEAVGRLAGGIAHDFNNLLTAIQGYTDMIMMDIDKTSTLYSDLEQVHNNVLRASELTRQMLLFSRKQPMEFMPMSLNDVIEDFSIMLERIIGENIIVNKELASDLNLVRADKGNIEQLIMNLALNARDAMPEGGKLVIKTESVVLDEELCKSISYSRPGDFICLSISDTGIGMSKEIMSHIFEPFFSSKEKGKGTGIGLSVVYGIVKHHEGWINVYSEQGKGSTFKVFLPTFYGKPKEKPKETPLLGELRGEGERILLVEDEQEVCEFAKKTLSKSGYIVFDAGSAEEALEIFEREKQNFDLVFSDVVLPDKTGIFLIEQIISCKPEIKTLLTSGYTDQKSQWTTICERGYCFLQKPYSFRDLLQAIKETIK